MRKHAWILGLAALAAGPAAEGGGLSEAPGAWVAVSVDLDGRPSDLYPAPDGSGRFYLEARRGSRYAVCLVNRTAERLGVVLTVDGLNAISGQRDDGGGRMYILDPWQRTTIQGWRTSLEEVRRFTFVDEQVSYAARSGKANARMGWIEIGVFRERHRAVQWPTPLTQPPPVVTRENESGRTDTVGSERSGDAPPRAEAVPPAEAKAGPAAAPERDRDVADASAARRAAGGAPRSFPGTGWGTRTHDPVVLVSFDPEPTPTERITLRYEYRPALVALGVLPPRPHRDRLAERERGEGFAPPPLW